jgi:DNA-3-methyladenine glycosylase II
LARTTNTGLDRLCASAPIFQELLVRNGEPPLWRREPTFATLTLLVLEQQVSLASARSAFQKLAGAIGVVDPEQFLELDDAELRAIGFSRQKAGYVRGIADLILSGDLDLRFISQLGGSEAIAELVKIRGVGVWTASCFALFVNGSPDIWPSGDRALYVSMRTVFAMDAVPTKAVADAMAEEWRPYRSIAATMLWHDYLGGASYRGSDQDGFVDGTGMVHP